MNQGVLDVVTAGDSKSDILGISELKWTGTGKFNSDDHHILLWARIP